MKKRETWYYAMLSALFAWFLVAENVKQINVLEQLAGVIIIGASFSFFIFRLKADVPDEVYTLEQRRVCDYLRFITHGQVGCGDDPIGFLIASHGAINELRRGADETIQRLRGGDQGTEDVWAPVGTNPGTDWYPTQLRKTGPQGDAIRWKRIPRES